MRGLIELKPHKYPFKTGQNLLELLALSMARKQWWISDSVWGIPPLRMLDSKDLEFLDAIPLSEEEQHGWTGPNKNRC